MDFKWISPTDDHSAATSGIVILYTVYICVLYLKVVLSRFDFDFCTFVYI